jgi:predicted lipoprotein with Yx(FWY)xxD motif
VFVPTAAQRGRPLEIPLTKENIHMKRLPTYAVVAGALALAACGSGSDGGGDSTASAAPADPSQTVSVASVDGIGDVLVDQSGMALYSADEEAEGSVLCVDACEAFWTPLEAGDGAPTAEPGVAGLDVITRPDGTQQVTADGRPLYTFSEDSPGEVTGDGFSDDFGDQHFTWHAALADGASASSSGGTGATDDTTTDDDSQGGVDGGYGF